MPIISTFHKKCKKGKDTLGNQRYQIKEYANIICDICGKEHILCLSRKKELDSITCHSCRRISQKLKSNPNYYIDKVKEIYGDTYIISGKPYTKSNGKVEMICKIHGEMTTARISDLLYSKKRYKIDTPIGSCKECHRLNRKKYTTNKLLKNCRLYYIYFPTFKMYKLGISSQKDLAKRTYNKDFILIWEKEISYEKGRILEFNLHKHFSNKNYKGKEKFLKDGNTELYFENILPDVNSIPSELLSDL